MKFIINVPEGNTGCKICPWINNGFVCQYCDENKLCNKLDFSKLHIEDYEDKSN